jgi:hypothetical protein
MIAKPAIAHGIIVRAHTIYTRVGGKPALPGISIKAPHTPQNNVVMRVYNNHGRLIIKTYDL